MYNALVRVSGISPEAERKAALRPFVSERANIRLDTAMGSKGTRLPLSLLSTVPKRLSPSHDVRNAVWRLRVRYLNIKRKE